MMGSSIAACLLANGHFVTVITPDLAIEFEAREKILNFLQQLLENGKLTDSPEVLMTRITISDELEVIKDSFLVIECIPEDTNIKKELFSRLESLLTPNAIIASNTSAIPISTLQKGMRHPGRLLGLHWAEPAHVTKFMEVVCGDDTRIDHAHELIGLSSSWGKEPSLVRKDIRGFISNRMMYAMIREGLYLVEQGYASIEDIDRACRNDLGQWMTFAGPFRFMDLTGISAYVKVMEGLFPELSNSDKVPDFIEKLVVDGCNGLSTRGGFYNYTEKSAANWEKLFMEFSIRIRDLSDEYPQDIGDH